MEQKIGFGTGLVKGGMQEYANTDPNPRIPFVDCDPPISKGELYLWSGLAGFWLGFVLLGNFFGWPW